ncbi:DUF397 domain-containing protein [Streptomyces sp. DT171]|uniref:DUF397 domain-containing protein n=1 Tax=Streptomyces sp. DT171 TaxID=3416524 RepID=UPI003CF5D972
MTDLTHASWRSSSYSDGGLNNCLEIADNFPGLVPVRDSKAPTGPALVIHADAWNSFIDDVRRTAP